MTDTLTARLLAEIERREGMHASRPPLVRYPDHIDREVLAYLAALRKIVETSVEGIMAGQGGEVKFARIFAAIAEALEVAP